jgi:glycosyltransferase involved in cell wall biosynthesis
VTRPTRVLLVLGTGQPGGAELATLTLLPHRPADLEVSALVLGPGPVAGRLEALGIRVWRSSLEGRPSPRRAARLHRGLLRVLEQLEPDVVHAVGIKAATLSVAAARTLGIPVVWQKVDFAHDDRLAAPLAVACSGVVAVSQAVAEAVPADRLIEVLGPPVRLPEDYRVPGDPSPPAIGSVGMLVPYKGHAHVIEAAARLSDRFPDLRVVIAGGPAQAAPGHEQELVETARRLGLSDRVELTGHLDRIEDVLDRLTVFVSATHVDEQGYGREGLSGAMLEASWAGLPVVATSGGGTPEGVQDGVTGTLVPPADVGRLTDAIAHYLGDPAACREAGERGAAFTRERFRPAALAERLFAALRDTAS